MPPESTESLTVRDSIGNSARTLGSPPQDSLRGIPDYLRDTYSWAYLHPASIWLFERDWVVNLILWGHMRRLTDSVLEEIDPRVSGPSLQVACVYGEFSKRLASRLHEQDSDLHLVDIAPIQIRNARDKLSEHPNVRFLIEDSSALQLSDRQFARTIVFFLLHEQPREARQATIAEALRVTRPGGKVIFVDYHLPSRSNPLRYFMRPVLRTLEPFALDLWESSIEDMLPETHQGPQVRTQLFCGGLYQKVVVSL